MLIRVSPRWLVNISEIRAVGHYEGEDTTVCVQFKDGSETEYECRDQETRDGFLEIIEGVLGLKTAYHPGTLANEGGNSIGG